MNDPSSSTSARAIVDHLGCFSVRERPRDAPLGESQVAPLLGEVEEVYGALVLGTRDYARKNGFEHVELGISGGIDSTNVAMIAVDALGPDCVTSVTMPST
ncbi:MAG: hypothetical protein QOI73_2559, partial [Solirubrobacteraceae bacterium]|nr:hypothetical protein [Solirubrobacteraceae bacterium]